jgi:hypothetical protein
MRKPDFFMVGAPRCGTTAMKHFLQQHPEIFMPPSRFEPNFFGTDLSGERFIRDEPTYLSLFTGANNEKRVGEKSTMYLYSKRAASNIRRFLPSASIIIMLRNPVDMVYSFHSLLVYLERENLVDLKDALDAEEHRKRGLRIPDAVSLQDAWEFFYRDKGKYADQVQRYLDTFSRERVHVIIFDDFIRDTAGAYRDTLQFLRVNPGFQPEFRKININRRALSRTFQNFLRNPPQPIRSFVRGITPILWRHQVVDALDRLTSFSITRPPMELELRRKLQEEFLPEVEQLSKLLGRDLTHWCQT